MSGIPTRDIERLSAYLDGVLQPVERSQLEQRLRAEPSLAGVLKDLEATRSLLRRVPQRRIPRSFTITPAMAGAQQKPAIGRWNSLNLVSAVATLMLIVVLAGDLWAGGLVPLGAAAPAAEEAPQAFLAQEADMKANETPQGGLGAGDVQGTEEFELYPSPEESGRFADEAAPVELRAFMLENARGLEIALGVLAIATGVLAWRARHKPS